MDPTTDLIVITSLLQVCLLNTVSRQSIQLSASVHPYGNFLGQLFDPEYPRLYQCDYSR